MCFGIVPKIERWSGRCWNGPAQNSQKGGGLSTMIGKSLASQKRFCFGTVLMLTILLLATLTADPGKSHSLSADKPHSQRWLMMQARRDAEVMRRNISRHHIPTKD